MNPSIALSSMVAVCSFSLTACVIATDAIVTRKETTFDSTLLGVWEHAEDAESAVITRGDSGTYAIRYTTDDKSGSFSGRLGRLGDHLVLDVWPTPGDDELPAPYTSAMIPGHVLLALEITADSLRTSVLDADTLLSSLRTGKIALHYEETSRLILHGTSSELRTALGRYLKTPHALEEADVWRRRTRVRMTGTKAAPCFESAAWHEADALFHKDPHWVGADAASSTDLGNGRILWMFGDSWIDASGRGQRRNARMVSNSIAIQEGSDPTKATIKFYWGTNQRGEADAFFRDRRGESLWLGSAVRVQDRLIFFLERVVRTYVGLGFDPVGWTAFMVDNPDDAPSMWRPRELQTFENPVGVHVGTAATFQQDGYVYALGSASSSHPMYVVRWTSGQARNGDLSNPQWWAGDRYGWVADTSRIARKPLFENGQSGLSIHLDRQTQKYLVIHTHGFGPADIVLRSADSLTAPWSQPRMLYRPSEYYRPNVMIYSAYAHPELTGADLIVTYSTNTFKAREQLSDTLIYYPRFVRLTRCRT